MSKITELLKPLAKPTKTGGICHTENFAEKLLEKIKYVENTKFKDEPLWINHTEERLLGISLSAPKILSYNTNEVTHYCSDFLNGKYADKMVFGVDIKEKRVYITKSGESEGKERADLTVIDETGRMKVKVWSSEYESNKSILVENNSIILTGKPGFGKYAGWIIATKIKQAK